MLQFLFSAYCLIVFHICTQFPENTLYGFYSYGADTISILNITEGHNAFQAVGRITVLNICYLSDDALYLYQDLRKYLKGFQSN